MINWDNSLEQIKNFEEVCPYPAWTTVITPSQKIKIFDAEPIYDIHSYDKSNTSQKQNLYFTSRRILNCKEIQLPNKRRMDAAAFLNGNKL